MNSYALYHMVTFPVFKVTAFLKSNIVKTACLKDKITIAQ